ncbi:MAG: sugar MFS transporter [Bacteroidota bacterium]
MDKKNYILSITILGALFFIFGFVTWLNGTLIPFLKISCELNNFQAYFVTFAFYISYFVMAIPSSKLLHITGFKKGMSVGLAVMAIGSLVFIPAALTRTFELFLTGLFLQGTGLAVLQTASNPYITILGPMRSAARRISIMGICNKVAGIISPLVLGAIVLKGANDIVEKLKTIEGIEHQQLLDSLANRVIMPYIVMAIVLVFLAILVLYSGLPDIDTDQGETNVENDSSEKNSIFQFPHLLLGFLAIFLYVGVEVMAGDTIVLYGQSQGISLEISRTFTSYTLVAMVIGYIIGIFAIPKLISQEKALTISAALGIIFSLIAIFTTGTTSVFFIAVLGLANAVMWPAIWPLALEGLGKFTKIGSALLIMGIAGGATLPLIYGRLADVINNQKAYWIMVPAYLFLLFFATIGHKIRIKKVIK